ncbi:MAG: hypothetical protein LBU34_02920, partial [Planctomycetaceae bacterium]|nr:hypothetical protein [Planctomycetaceae bacterium]
IKPWYRRRRYWITVILLLLVYFCLIPSPLQISPETTGITEPLTPDGIPDYFADYEKMWIGKLCPPEENGQRLMIANCGPRVLEQAKLAEFPWEELQKNEFGKMWFENYWIPLCENMFIDPYAKPRFYESRGWYSTIMNVLKINLEDSQKLWDKLVEKPWQAEDFPETAEWLKDRSPVLDLFGIAVRKPTFLCWRKRAEEGWIGGIMLPDVQSNRDFARDLRIRITERLGHGDVDGAWYDTMSMFYLSRKHYLNDPVLVTNLVGAAIETQAYEAAKIILKYGQLNQEQLQRFSLELTALPRKYVFSFDFDKRSMYDALCRFYKGDKVNGYDTNFNALQFLTYLPLPFDANIAGKRITEFVRMSSLSGQKHPVPLQKRFNLQDSLLKEKEKRTALNSPRFWLSLPLIRTRSQLIADLIIIEWCPALEAVNKTLDTVNTQQDLLRIAVALKLYNKTTNKYPEKLDELVPKYLDEIPLDLFTKRQTITYKKNPKDGTEYIVYSYGPNGKDDSGISKLEACKNTEIQHRHNFDIALEQ